MKLGISTYSLFGATKTGEMTLLDVIDYIANIGGEHVEIVPLGITLTEHPELVQQIVERAAERNIEISNYAVGGNFSGKSAAEITEEVERLKAEVDVAAALGVSLMRHDVASSQDISIAHFLEELPTIANACAEVADYAATKGITTSVENHGYYVQASDRVQALVNTVNRPNYKTTLDIGNFMCADENPVVAVAKNIGMASMVHLKDFYLRPAADNKGEGWFRTSHGNYLRGAIVGDGDIPMREVLRIVKESGYDGYLSIEFEGMEECKRATKIALDNARAIWDSI
ncbi:sugar phosphate isomerase/epimerase family protein [Paenibacillus daejeonensis]|uniref:sugar phosphate isomerase/epimerase family protein n=1 Tax=Paenibacillus daejeonensis TaxID=135193 RepID=UPI000370E01B|nr:sugar phosphate isomerase/epimerase family protein [Paenibacillus daejeonensis]